MHRRGTTWTVGAFHRPLRCEPLESRRLLAGDVGITSTDSGVLTVHGDRTQDNLNDVIVVHPVAGDASVIEVVVNGTVAATRALEGLRRIVIAGGRGDDSIRIDVPDLTIGCTIRGGPGDDTISGGPRGDRIHGGEGNDTIDGGDGNDEIVGGIGDDYLRGGRGADRVVGGVGIDTIDGGLGNDVLLGGDGDDTLDGEAGIDILHGENGDDTLLGGTGRDRLFAGSGADRLFGIGGRDRFVHDDLDSVTESELANPLVVAASESAIHKWLLGQATRWNHEAVFGEMAFGVRGVEMAPTNGGSPATTAGATPGASAPAAARDHSSTNNQVAGVDEADRVRTDGQFIYILNDNELLVIDADPASLAIVSRMPIEGYGSVLYLHGDRITVLSQRVDWSIPEPWQPIDPVPMPIDDDGGDGQSPGDVQIASMPGIMPPRGGKPRVIATVIDIADRSRPVVVETMRIDGSLAASRSIGDSVTLVVENRPRFNTSDLTSALPVVRSKTVSGTISQPLVEPGNLYLPADGGGSELLSIVAFTPTDATPGIDRSVSTLGVAGTVYASTDSITIAAADYGSWWGTSEGATTLHTFSLEGDMPYLAGGSVPGFVRDQFAIDAPADGSVRIVTQTGWGREASTNLFVLEPEGGTYVEIGSVTGIAPGEAAMSARFVGDTAYIVTFEQVDPLFVIDLVDPTEPTIVGELVIPGFSTYLHPVDGTHLIGIGRSADLSGVKLSLFDVSVPATPVEASFVEFVAAGGYAWSAAEWDHHAFSFFADRDVVAIPVSQWTWEASSDDTEWFGSSTSSHTLAVFSVDPVEGRLQELARIDHESPVMRSLRIGDRLYSISEGSLSIVEFADPRSVVANLPFDPPA